MRYSGNFVLAAALVLVGCGPTDVVQSFPERGEPLLPVVPPPDPAAVPLGTFAASVNGALWQANEDVTVTWTGNVLKIATAGTNNLRIASAGPPGIERMTLIIRLVDVDGPGVYELRPPGDGASLVVALTERVRQGADFTWSTSYHEAFGTVTITTLTANQVAGAFFGELETASRSATSLGVFGRFNLPIE